MLLASQHLVSFDSPSAIFTGYEYSESCSILWWFVSEKGWNSDCIQSPLFVSEKGRNSDCIHSSVFVPEKGWNSGYIHSSVFVSEKGWNSDCIYSSVFVPEKGWNSDSIQWLYVWLYVCAREVVELWLYSVAPCYARERVEIWGGSNCWTGIWKETMEWNDGMEQFTYTVAANWCNCRCSIGLLYISLQKLYEQGWIQGNIYVLYH